MNTDIMDDLVTNRIVRQLTDDYETIGRFLEEHQSKREKAVKAQNFALAAFEAELREIEEEDMDKK